MLLSGILCSCYKVISMCIDFQNILLFTKTARWGILLEKQNPTICADELWNDR